MANYYNINRSIEAYEIRMIDPDDGQLKKLTDIPSLGGGGGGGDGFWIHGRAIKHDAFSQSGHFLRQYQLLHSNGNRWSTRQQSGHNIRQ